MQEVQVSDTEAREIAQLQYQMEYFRWESARNRGANRRESEPTVYDQIRYGIDFRLKKGFALLRAGERRREGWR